MKLKRIMSMLLATVLISGSVGGIFGALPVYADDDEEVVSTYEQATDLNYIKEAYVTSTVAEKVAKEQAQGYTKCLAVVGDYALYCNIYTGEVYYKNIKTGKYVATNPINYSRTASTKIPELLSQIIITYSGIDGEEKSFYSFTDAAERGQINVTGIRNGIRVAYTIGRTDTNYLLPGWIMPERFESLILEPILNRYLDVLANESAIGKTKEELREIYDSWIEELGNGGALTQLYKTVVTDEGIKDKISKTTAREEAVIGFQFQQVCSNYEKLPLTESYANVLADCKHYGEVDEETGEPKTIYVLSLSTNDANVRDILKRRIEKVISAYCSDTYTYAEKKWDDEDTGYVAEESMVPVFRLALEYILNQDGQLTINLPANGIRFDEANFNLHSIKVLPMFGAGDVSQKVVDVTQKTETVHEGYVFYPDGSGALLDFADIRNRSEAAITSMVYGDDSAYYNIKSKHQESIRLPVFGIVDSLVTTKENSREVYDEVTGQKYTEKLPNTVTKDTSGFVAYLTEGESLANLTVAFGGDTHNYISVYPTYTPIPNDAYKLTDATSVSNGDNKAWVVFSEKKYTGNFTMKVSMLIDQEDAERLGYEEDSYYDATWVGMAKAYRDYLWKNTDKKVEVTDSLMLYIESFGSVKAQDKVLSIPVTVDKELTTFDNVREMYEGIAEALREKYEKENFSTNINFKLTGFANGGMQATYPAQLKWMNAVGGAEGLESLLTYAASDKVNGTLGVYPEFEFSYNSYQSSFDGTSLKDDISRAVDNRYASKQIYDCLYQQFTSYFDLVVSPDAIARHYANFSGEYLASSELLDSISAGSLGSDLNSSFYDKNPLNREDAKNQVIGVLKDMANEQNGVGNVMISGGNAFTVPYADHILDAPLTSSQYKYNSRSVPFFGMVMHGYVNYAGSPINEASDSKYQTLKSIENGASLYYVLSMQNLTILKNDPLLSQYYSISYEFWLEDMVTQYKTMNDAIGDLQDYTIENEISLVAERILDPSEREAYMEELRNLAMQVLKDSIATAEKNGIKDYRFQHLTKQLFDTAFTSTCDEARARLTAKQISTAAESLLYTTAETRYAALAADSTALAEAIKNYPELKLVDDIVKAQAVYDASPTEANEKELHYKRVALTYAQNNKKATADFYANNVDDAAFFEFLLTVVGEKTGFAVDALQTITLKEMYNSYLGNAGWESVVGKPVIVEVDREAILQCILEAYAPIIDRFHKIGKLDEATQMSAVETFFIEEVITVAVDNAIASYYSDFIVEYINSKSQYGDTTYTKDELKLTKNELEALRQTIIDMYLLWDKADAPKLEDVLTCVEKHLQVLNENETLTLTTLQTAIITEVVNGFMANKPFESDFKLDKIAITYDETEIYTNSLTLDKDYKATEYTVNDDSVVFVIYEKGDKKVGFILNYNVFSVSVTVDAGTSYDIAAYDFKKIDDTATVEQLIKAWKEAR